MTGKNELINYSAINYTVNKIKYMTEEKLIEQLKAQIIKSLSLEDDITPNDIDPDAPLFVEGLGLDSIDAIELILLLDKQYGIKIENPQQRKEVLKSVRTMAKLILKERNKDMATTL
jgi:acyl carrier protein